MPVLPVLGRLAGAGLLIATATIHLRLYSEGYSTLPKIGLLFLLNGIGAIALAAALLVCWGRLLQLAAAAGALLEAGTLGGLYLATVHGLFGFRESSRAQYYWPSVWVEAAGIVVLVALAVAGDRRRLPRLWHARGGRPAAKSVSASG